MKQQWHLVSILFMLFSFMTSSYAVEEASKPENSEAAPTGEVVAAATAEAAKKPKEIYDKNNDGKIDAADWKQFTEIEKRTYARKLVTDLGQDPDSSLGGLGTREEQYLQGLKAQFEE